MYWTLKKQYHRHNIHFQEAKYTEPWQYYYYYHLKYPLFFKNDLIQPSTNPHQVIFIIKVNQLHAFRQINLGYGNYLYLFFTCWMLKWIYFHLYNGIFKYENSMWFIPQQSESHLSKIHLMIGWEQHFFIFTYEI